MNKRFLFVSLLVLLVLLPLASCCVYCSTYRPPTATYVPPSATPGNVPGGSTTGVPSGTEESSGAEEPSEEPTSPTNFIVIDLGEVKTQDGVKTYDFNLRTGDGFTVFGLGAIDDGKLVILLRSQAQITEVVWEHGVETKNFSPQNGPPEDLEMKIEGAPGENFWFILPLEAAKGGTIKVFVD